MMQYYLQIRILPDLEFGQSMLMNALYSKLHRVLVKNKNLNIGISLPHYSLKPILLGDILRLHGSETDLERLCAESWLIGMTDHVEVSKIYPVTKTEGYLIYRRKQVKSNAERLRRRCKNREHKKGHIITDEELQIRIPDSVEETLDIPFVRIKSQSTGQVFRLFIEQQKVMEPKEGIFNRYGLSQTATVPNIKA